MRRLNEPAWIIEQRGDTEISGCLHPLSRISHQWSTHRKFDAVPDEHPFALRYHEVGRVDWESCARVLDNDARRRSLSLGWAGR